ncbi:MAG: PhoU domain-containing protein [Acidimicrobiales bacterium]|nr:PhoU domain-containing protein [Acidimicrobiales bacterium]
MVMSFFRRSEGGFEAITAHTVSMLADARHSFDMASTALLSGASHEAVADDVYSTDDRINATEHELRRELVVHVSVQGTDDIGAVLAYTLLIKKIERIGDQAKNILDLAQEGVDLSGTADSAELTATRREISAMMGETADIVSEPDATTAAAFRERADALRFSLETQIRECMHSDQPGSEVVPRAILYRYWKRIVANLAGIVISATEPLHHEVHDDDLDD